MIIYIFLSYQEKNTPEYSNYDRHMDKVDEKTVFSQKRKTTRKSGFFFESYKCEPVSVYK